MKTRRIEVVRPIIEDKTPARSILLALEKTGVLSLLRVTKIKNKFDIG